MERKKTPTKDTLLLIGTGLTILGIIIATQTTAKEVVNKLDSWNVFPRSTLTWQQKYRATAEVIDVTTGDVGIPVYLLVWDCNGRRAVRHWGGAAFSDLQHCDYVGTTEELQ